MSDQRQKDYFESVSPSNTSPASTPGLPGHDWGSRPPLSARYQPRRGSTASSVGSIGGSLDIPHSRFNIARELGQNAISTLLQPPIVRTGLLPHTSAPASSAHRPPSTRDIPPVTLTNIPHIDPSAFKPYLAQVGSLFEARARTEHEEALPQHALKERAGSKEEDFAHVLDKRLRNEQQRPRQGSRQSYTTALSPTESPQPHRKRSISRRQLTVTPLSTIPNVYFDEQFHLENPRTFDIVSERSEVVRTPLSPTDESKGANGFMNGSAPAPRKALATNAILQEKLSWYLDTVEIHLIASISAASQSFFAALGSLKELHSEAADSVDKIKKLRGDLAKLDEDMAVGGLEIVDMKQRRNNLRKLNDAVDQLRNVVNGASHCEELVDQGDLETALDRIAILEEYTCGRSRHKGSDDLAWLTPNPLVPIRDLRRLRALDGFAEGMDQLRARVGKGYEVRFLEALLADLRQHVTDVPNPETLKRWASASQRSRGGHSTGSSVVPAYLHTPSTLRQNLSVILNGLGRSKSLSIASVAFREAIMREMKSLIRQHLPSSSDDDVESVASVSTTRSRATSQQDKSARLARNLRALGPDDAEEILMKMYCGVGEALRRLQTQVKMLLDVTSAQALSPTTNGPRSPPKSPNMGSIDATTTKRRARADSTPLQEELMQALDLSSLLGQAVDAAQAQITKILKVRAEQSTTLGLTHFLRYFTLNRLFADECEAVSGRSGASLKNVVNTHISEFIAGMAKMEREQLERTMDNDPWSAKDFTDRDDTVLSQVLEGMSSDPQRWLTQAHVWENNTAPKINGSINAPDTNGAKEQTRSAIIEEEKFLLVNSAIFLLHGISRFETLIACIPSISADVSKELVDYLRFFNSRSCQLVLGAGATRSTAALANINTKHLALASQSLSFVITLIPYVREFVRRRPGMGPEKMGEYDKTRRLYQDHQVSINEKLVEIMSGRAMKHVRQMNATDFDLVASKEQQDSTAISKHMETLCKETVVLQRTLGRYLPEGEVARIMGPVFADYKMQWGEAFKAAKVATEGGKNRLLRDAEFLDTRLNKIEGAGDIGNYIIGLVKEKSVAALPTPPLSAPAAPAAPAEKSKEESALPPEVKTGGSPAKGGALEVKQDAGKEIKADRPEVEQGE